MPDLNPVPPQIPSHLSMPRQPAFEPLGAHAGEREPISGPVAAVEAILRQPRRVMYQVSQARPGSLILAMILVAVVCSLIYGVVVGTFSHGTQLWAAPVKIACGLVLSAAICFPSLYIFTCLSGSQARLAEICGLVAGLLLLTTILLIGFAPVAWLFSQSTESVVWMGALHLLFWFIATAFGLRFLSQAFAHSQARSQAGLNTWCVIFVLVAVQMTTALRPIVGTAPTFLPEQKKFFLAHWSDCLSATEQGTPTAASR
ncbi:MAG TPA: hypothetical protein VG167_10685 [Verrucomicrobiae bacterium]|nr:hypothetical protein [Verrucomicrobiae bacterium]